MILITPKESPKLPNKATVLALKKLEENNKVLINWISVHSGFLGNEKADTFANYTDATLLKLPIPNKREDET